jgi:hypothetical protein
MRKYILILLVCITGLVACTNDDITIDYDISFKIDPSTVISPFTYEMVPGELESFYSDYKLRVRLLIYNSEGTLVTEDVRYLTNYASVMSSSQSLPHGKYIALTVTDVVQFEGDNIILEFWKLGEYDLLTKAKIEDAGYLGLQYKMLGISKTDFTVNDTSNNDDIIINVQPAGALILAIYYNVWTYSDVSAYGLIGSKFSDACIFDNQGNYAVSVRNNNGSFDWWHNRFDLEGFSTDYPAYYNFNFELPMSNLNLKFQALLSDGEQYLDLSGPMTINPKVGEEYLFNIDIATWNGSECDAGYEIVNGNNTRSSAGAAALSPGAAASSVGKNVLYLKNVK